MTKIREEKKYQGNNIDSEPVYSIYNIYGKNGVELAKSIFPDEYEYRGSRYSSAQICEMHNREVLK